MTAARIAKLLPALPLPAAVLPRVAVSLLAASLLALGGCDSGGGNKPPPPPPPAPPPPLESGPKIDLEQWTVLGENPKWKPIAKLFDSYTQRPIEALANPWLSNLTADIPVPPEPEPELAVTTDEAATDEAAADVEVTCATRYPIDRYSLGLIMTGLAQPKAMLVGAQGEQCIVVRGDAVGTEQGRVRAILQYEVRITIDGQTEPKILTIAPPISAAPEDEEEDSDVP